MKKPVLCLLAAALAVALAVPAAAAEEWRLLGRHGGCVTLPAAAARKPVLAGIDGPDGLIARLQRRGVAHTVKEEKVGDRRAVAIAAPSLSLALMFVPAGLCRE